MQRLINPDPLAVSLAIVVLGKRGDHDSEDVSEKTIDQEFPRAPLSNSSACTAGYSDRLVSRQLVCDFAFTGHQAAARRSLERRRMGFPPGG